jgi:hypothetical protein
MATNISQTHATYSTSTEDCAICLLPLTGHKTLKLHLLEPPFHEFHKSCISCWAEIKNECPLCKRAPAIVPHDPLVSMAVSHILDSFVLTEEQETTVSELNQMIESDNYAGVDLYFTENPINRLILEKAIEKAAYLGKIEILEMLLGKGEISMNKRGRALSNAAENGHLDAVNLLIEDENVPPDILGHALVVATRFDQEACAETIIEHGTIDTTAYAKALREAAFNMNDSLLGKLKTTSSVTGKEKVKAVKLATKSIYD